MHVDTLKFYKYSPVVKPMYQGKYCHQPFDTLQIDSDGDVQLCDCQHHMPYTIGNIYKNDLLEIWNSAEAEKVRQSIRDEKFTYCSWTCTFLTNLPERPAVLPPADKMPSTIKIDLDRSCNLKCASCREHAIIEKDNERIQKQNQTYEQIKQWTLENPNKILHISPMSSGEIFASPSGLSFLRSLTNYSGKNIRLDITTNGTLLYRNRELLQSLRPLLSNFAISIDAATPETYEQVRGGDWQELMRGLEFIREIKMPVMFKFCIQQKNWHEIEQFAELGHRFGAHVNFQKLLDWGHWTIAWWHDNNVFDRKRPEFDQAIEKLRATKEKYGNKVSTVGEITKYLNKL